MQLKKALSLRGKTLLITRPNYDPTTSYLHYWSQRTISIAEQRGASVIDIVGSKVTRTEFEGRVKKVQPQLIVLNGHGAGNRLAGQDHKIILDHANADITNAAVVYALSCESSQSLGPQAVIMGAKSYIGYNESFVFVCEKDKSTTPLNDKTAELFMRPALTVSENLIKGKTTSEAVNKAIKEFDKSIVMAANSDVQSDHSSYVKFLVWDRLCLTYSGNGNATV